MSVLDVFELPTLLNKVLNTRRLKVNKADISHLHFAVMSGLVCFTFNVEHIVN